MSKSGRNLPGGIVDPEAEALPSEDRLATLKAGRPRFARERREAFFILVTRAKNGGPGWT